MIGRLPTSLTVADVEYRIRTDFRDVLNIIAAYGDPELEDMEKAYVCLCVLYEDFESIPQEHYEAAYKAAVSFIDCGMPTDGRGSARTMDWEQDEPILFPAINKVAGCEVRAMEYLHWWTFMGYFMEIHEGIFSHVLSIRHKKAKGKKLEKWERDFWQANKDICVLRQKLTEEEQAAKDRLNALLN
jgi:hypothetical protein